jgi:hypothetical protein
MKYLKKFNEELKSSTYQSAVRKLKAKGHERRAEEIEEHSTNMNWKEMIDKFKKWGECKMEFHSARQITGNFYLGLYFMDDPTAESVDFAKSQYDDLKIYFTCLVIPADEETKKSCMCYLSDPYFDNGFFQGSWPVLEYENEGGSLKFRKLDMAEGDNKFYFSRKAAVIFKKQLLACFEPGNDYDSGYTNITNMYEKIRTTLQDEDFTLEFDYDMDDIYNDIKKIPINDLYKD